MLSFPSHVTKPFVHPFTVSNIGLYAVTVIATCRSGRQTGQYGGEDLRVEIDGLAPREIPPVRRTQVYNIPPAWNGTRLKGLPKTVIFILRLDAGDHELNFVPYRGAEILAEPTIEPISNPRSFMAVSNQQAEDGDRRPWLTIALVNLPLKNIDLDATAKGRWGDSDDLKLIIDSNIKLNPSKLAILRRDWLISGSLLKKLLRNERQQFAFEEDLPSGAHYIELWVDRMPRVHRLVLDFGNVELEPDESPKRVPTVKDPKWTGDFSDDNQAILLARLIFGEAEGESQETKIWVGASVINRLNAQTWWGDTLHEVILKEGQYDPFKKDDPVFKKITDPLNTEQKFQKEAWLQSYDIAKALLSGDVLIPTEATHFHGIGVNREWFLENVVPNGRFLEQVGNTHFYWSPN